MSEGKYGYSSASSNRVETAVVATGAAVAGVAVLGAVATVGVPILAVYGAAKLGQAIAAADREGVAERSKIATEAAAKERSRREADRAAAKAADAERQARRLEERRADMERRLKESREAQQRALAAADLARKSAAETRDSALSRAQSAVAGGPAGQNSATVAAAAASGAREAYERALHDTAEASIRLASQRTQTARSRHAVENERSLAAARAKPKTGIAPAESHAAKQQQPPVEERVTPVADPRGATRADIEALATEVKTLASEATADPGETSARADAVLARASAQDEAALLAAQDDLLEIRDSLIHERAADAVGREFDVVMERITDMLDRVMAECDPQLIAEIDTSSLGASAIADLRAYGQLFVDAEALRVRMSGALEAGVTLNALQAFELEATSLVAALDSLNQQVVSRVEADLAAYERNQELGRKLEDLGYDFLVAADGSSYLLVPRESDVLGEDVRIEVGYTQVEGQVRYASRVVAVEDDVALAEEQQSVAEQEQFELADQVGMTLAGGEAWGEVLSKPQTEYEEERGTTVFDADVFRRAGSI